MRISTRGSYALRVMSDLAEFGSDRPIPLKDISARENISHKYLENIMNELAKAGLVISQHGKSGGYRLSKAPENYTIGEILRVTEGELAPVNCLGGNAVPCDRKDKCRPLIMWTGLYNVINNYLDSVSLADIINPDGGSCTLKLD